MVTAETEEQRRKREQQRSLFDGVAGRYDATRGGYADIAAQLHMSLATVKAHVSRLLAKLDAANRVQIALLVQDATASRPPRLR